MRKSFDGLHAIIQSEFQRDVRLGDLFLFLNRRRDRLKLTYWDRDGLAIWMKRLER
jgi:transposase